MIISEEEKNRIRGLHREHSVIKEDGGPASGICRHGGERTQGDETNKPCRTVQNKYAVMNCTTDADCIDGGVWSGGINPSYTPGDCYCDTTPIQPHQPQSGTDTGIVRPGGISTSDGAVA